MSGSAGRKKGGKKKKSFLTSWKLLAATALAAIVLAGSSFVYVFWLPNVNPNSENVAILLPRDANFGTLTSQLRENHFLKNDATFWWASRAMRFSGQVKPGRYLLKKGMSNLQIIRKLRAGIQDPVSIRIKSHRTLQEIVRDVDGNLEISEMEILETLENPEFRDSLGFSSATLMGMFVPNTYQVYWNISAEEFCRRMKKEYERFWNESRREKARNAGLTPEQVVALASIVQAETYMVKERPTIAGVYLNRLKKGMRLEADPTVIFATGDFSIRRVLKRHLEVDSPYNTYKNTGLPPGPINNPEISALDAVLNAERHDFIFFCARSDFSGYHTFSKNLSDHNKAAQAYHSALSRRNR